MKLFNIVYTQDNDNGSYLVVGEDSDDDKSIINKELSSVKWEDQSCLYHVDAIEITEIDGYKIIVERKNK